MKVEFEIPQMTLENQIQEVVVNSMEKSIAKYFEKRAAKEWMSIKEACNYIDVSYNTFQRLREHGLPIAEINGIKRVSKKAIDEFLEKHSF